jgi:hypothetical protein
MIDISNCPKTGVSRKADINEIKLNKKRLFISSLYEIFHFDADGNNIDEMFSTIAKRYSIDTIPDKDIDPETGAKVEDIEGVEGLITEYTHYTTLGWDYVLSLNPDAAAVVLDGNYGTAYALLLRDDALGLV